MQNSPGGFPGTGRANPPKQATHRISQHSKAMQSKQSNTRRTKRKHSAQNDKNEGKAKQRKPKESNASQSKAEQSTKQRYAPQSEAAKSKTDVARHRKANPIYCFRAMPHPPAIAGDLLQRCFARVRGLTAASAQDVCSWRMLNGAGCTTLTADVSSSRTLNGAGCTTLTALDL